MGCIHLLGGSFGVLQMVAWASMLIQYSSSEGVSEGFTKTFNGEHPCSLCVAIKDAKSSESEKQPLQVAGEKLSLKELAFAPSFDLKPPRANTVPPAFHTDPVDHFTARSDAPPLPPPRHFA